MNLFFWRQLPGARAWCARQLRGSDIDDARNFARDVLDSLSEGIAVFDREGICLPSYSRACLDLLGESPQGKTIWDVLKIPEAHVADFKRWYSSLYQHGMAFSELIEWGPKTIASESTQGAQITLKYYSLRSEDGVVIGVIVVVTDKTQEYEASLAAERERAFASMVVKISRNKYQFLTFVGEGRVILIELRTELEAARAAARPANLEMCARLVHTLKGGASLFMLKQVCELAHEYENKISELKEASREAQVNAVAGLCDAFYLIEDALERFILMSREIVGSAVEDGERRLELRARDLDEFAGKLAASNAAPELVKEFRHRFLAEPVSSFLSHFDEFLASSSKAQAKSVKPIVFDGRDNRIIGSHYSELFSCLVHAFRNIVDHGIEAPHERKLAGKDPAATVRVSFFQEKSGWRLVIADDGRGIDPNVIREKLRARGRVSLAETETDHEILQHILDGGLSTRVQVDQFSGRGVGMDAIKHACEHLGGRVEIASLLGKGTTLTCIFPNLA